MRSMALSVVEMLKEAKAVAFQLRSPPAAEAKLQNEYNNKSQQALRIEDSTTKIKLSPNQSFIPIPVLLF
jgi:hypothetical protein